MALLRECLRSVRTLRGDHVPPPLFPARGTQVPRFSQQSAAIGRRRLPGTPNPMHIWTMADGMHLAGDSWGDPEAPLVLLLHGVGQTRHAWGGTGALLANAGYRAVAFDARGHGDSDWATDCDYSCDAMVRALCPHSESVSVAGAEHMVAGDLNDGFGRAATEFLQRTVPVAIPRLQLN